MKKITKTIIGLLLILSIISIGSYIMEQMGLYTLSDIENLILNTGFFGPLVFIIIYVISSLILIPITIFTIMGGAIFGFWLGLIYVLIGAGIGASIGFFITRYSIKNKEIQSSNPVINKIIDKINYYGKENGFKTILILRLLYLPYMPVTYGAGLVKTIEFKEFITATTLTNIIGSFGFVLLGDQIENGIFSVLVTLCIILISLSIPKITGKIKNK